MCDLDVYLFDPHNPIRHTPYQPGDMIATFPAQEDDLFLNLQKIYNYLVMVRERDIRGEGAWCRFTWNLFSSKTKIQGTTKAFPTIHDLFCR